MLGRITSTENAARWKAARGKLRTSKTKNKSKRKNLSPGRYSIHTVLRAHEDLNQPNNDDTLNQEDADDWRKFRAKLVSMEKTNLVSSFPYSSEELGQDWAHEISTPEKGCLLVAKQPNLGMFSETAILVLHHDEAKSTLGLILNTPSPSILENSFIRGWDAGAFSKERIYIGGPLEMSSLHILHPHGDLEKSTKVIDGVFVGGFADARLKVESGVISPSDFKLIVGISSWGPYQLARELQDNVWYVVSASRSLLLQKDDGGLTDRFQEDYWTEILRLSGLEVPY
eukprot:g6345.t1